MSPQLTDVLTGLGKHGRQGYSYYGCRCPVCTEGNRVACLAYRRRRGDRPMRVYQADRRALAETRRTMIGDLDQARTRHSAALKAARAAATGPIAELAAAQAQDDHYGHHVRSWLVSLDARDVYGRERYETLRVAA